MYGGLLKSASAVAIFAAAGLYGASPAKAADLGGDCCADLEERVAELEATTVRKGNRKVSLQISGYVSHNVMAWDDGISSDVYIGDGGNYGSRWRFTGSAKISPQLTAGFLYEFGIANNSISTQNQSNGGDDLGGVAVPGILRDSTVWLRHSQLGMIKIGHGSTSTDNLVLIDVGGLSGASTPDVALYGGGMRIASQGFADGYTEHTWTNMINGGISWDTTRRNHVLYETPALAGFTVQAAVAEDNYWDIALRYAGEIGGFRIAGGIGYQEDTEFNGAAGAFVSSVSANQKASEVKGSLSVMHIPTGLFVTGSAGTREIENLQFAAGGTVVNRDGSYWHLAGGLSRNFFGIGKTVLFGEYGNHSDMLALTALAVTSSDATNWGIGVIQYVDAAAMEIFLTYKHFEGDFVANATGTNQVVGVNQMRDLNMVIFGTRISF